MIESIEFGLLSPKTIKKMSGIKVEKPELYDPDGYPIDGGLADLNLGVIDPGLRCRTCGGTIGQCLGHFGHMELTKPVVHPLFGKKIYYILRSICSKCSKPLLSKDRLKTADDPLYLSYKEGKKISECPHCGAEQEEIKFYKPTSYRDGKKDLTAEDVRKRLENISDKDAKLLGIGGGRPEWVILTLLPVPPVTVRPSITLESGNRSEDDLTHKLVDVVRINERLRKNLELGAPEFIIQDIWELLQYHVSTLMDNEISTLPPARHRSGRALNTLVQRLSKKDGRFRGNLSGKRTNFSARTVISPDPRISVNEVGIPLVIAKELTLPVVITKFNIEDVKKIIENGPNKHPGANYVLRPDGIRKKITDENKEELKEEIKEGYVVERHIQNGDISIFNRQPSLHRMSMMAHKVKIMRGKTFRLNLCTTIPYNADFDGDEMNLHIPQTQESQTEAEMLMSVEDNIRSPRYGLPIITFKHDHITGAYLLTKDDTKFSKRETAELLASIGLDKKLKKDEYTGKELFSMLLPSDLNIKFKSAVGGEVVIKKGKLKEGVIDENALGELKGKLLNKINLKYGPEESKTFLDKLSVLALELLSREGFSISIDDLDVSEKARKKIRRTISNTQKQSKQIISKYKKGELKSIPGMDKFETLENMIQEIGGRSVNKGGKIVKKDLPENSATIMAKTGARGSFVNLSQICALVGQEALEGERIHRGYTGRTVSHFEMGNLGLKPRGFADSGYKGGLSPVEFFFDAMNSRENLMDKSLHTRHSGYMERRLINALQDLKVESDKTVRDGRGHIIQFLAGEDGVDPAKSDNGKINMDVLV